MKLIGGSILFQGSNIRWIYFKIRILIVKLNEKPFLF